MHFTFHSVHLTSWCACHVTHSAHVSYYMYTLHGKSLHRIDWNNNISVPAWECGQRSPQAVLHQPCSLNHEIFCMHYSNKALSWSTQNEAAEQWNCLYIEISSRNQVHTWWFMHLSFSSFSACYWWMITLLLHILNFSIIFDHDSMHLRYSPADQYNHYIASRHTHTVGTCETT